MKYNTYVISTIGYACMILLGIISLGYAVIKNNVILFIVSVLIVLVALDNFFCASRIRNTGISIKGKYALPPFLKKK